MAIPLALGWSPGVAWVLAMAACLGTLTIHDITTGVIPRRPRPDGRSPHSKPTRPH
jgi:hypothetical protein